MRNWHRAVLTAAIMLTGCGLGAGSRPVDEPEADPATRREIAQGVVIGTEGREGAQAWYGIPYAQPPVGDLRWRAPRPAAGWTGTFEALDFSQRCPQFAGGKDPEGEEGEIVGSEDCLYLNVWAPPGHEPDGEALPVMVWLYGGGNVSGWAGQYEMGRLAARQDVVVVSLNYRLGPLGWFAHEAIRDTAEVPLDATANFANLDSVLALEWVRDNIAAFGGDPDRVTIFGESAGGVNVAVLLAAPQASGLFHRAIMQSGSLSTHSMQEAEYGPPSEDLRRGHSSREAIAVLAETDAVDPASMPASELAAWLRGQSAETILATYRRLRQEQAGALDFGGYDSIDVARDGIVIPERGLEATLADPALFNAVPVITGTNRDELRGLGFFDGSQMNNFGPLAYWPDDWDYYEAYGDYPSRIWRASSVDEPAEAMSAAGHEGVYAYRFDWDEQGTLLFTDVSRLIGAAHAIDLGFVTGNFEDPVSDLLGLYFRNANRRGREILSAQMMSYWSEFAATGDPGQGRHGELPDWPSWDENAGGGSVQLLDTPDGGGIRTLQNPVTVETVLDELEVDPRLQSAQQRCSIVLKVRELFPFLDARFAPYRDRYCERND